MGNPDKVEEPQAELAILEAELKRLRDAVWETWRGYLTWFTWFYGAQILVLGWIMTRKQEFPSRVNIIVLAGAAIILNLINIHATLRFRSFCVLETRRADHICRLMTERVGMVGLNIDITPGFPGDLIRSGGDMGVIAFATATMVWFYVIYSIAT